MKKTLATAGFIVCLAVWGGLARSQVHPLAGTTAATFLKIGAGARYSAMGETGIAFSDDATACYWNPSRLNVRTSFHFQHNSWLAGTTVDDVYFSKGYRKHRLGLGGRLLSSGDIPLRDAVPAPDPIDHYRAYDFFGSLSYAFAPTPLISAGISYRRLYQKIYLSSAYGNSLQAGLNVNLLDGRLSLAGTADNVGPRMQMAYNLFKQPTAFKIGAAYRHPDRLWNGRAMVAAEVVKPLDGGWQVRIGSEYIWRDQLALRLGYKTGHDTESYSLGAGYRWRYYSFDYAFIPNRFDLGISHRFSLGIGH